MPCGRKRGCARGRCAPLTAADVCACSPNQLVVRAAAEVGYGDDTDQPRPLNAEGQEPQESSAAAQEEADEAQDAQADDQETAQEQSAEEEKAEADAMPEYQSADEAEGKEVPAEMDAEHKAADNGDVEPESGEEHIQEVRDRMRMQDTALSSQDEREAQKDTTISTGIYLKKHSMLHDQYKENGVRLHGAVTGLKELQEKKVNATSSMKKGIKRLMTKQIYQASSRQGSYYHKIPPVPKTMVKEETSELTDFASDIPTVTGDINRGVPDEALQTYKKALVKYAVGIAAKKTAELKHKKFEKAKLAKIGVEAATRQRVLQAKIRAAATRAKDIKDEAVKTFGPPKGLIPEPTDKEKKVIEAQNEQEEDMEAMHHGHLGPHSATMKAAKKGLHAGDDEAEQNAEDEREKFAEHEEGFQMKHGESEHNSDYSKDNEGLESEEHNKDYAAEDQGNPEKYESDLEGPFAEKGGSSQ